MRKLANSICVILILSAVSLSAQTIPAWQPNTAFTVGALVAFNGQEFQCIQAHTSQVGWEPPNVPALWRFANGGAPDFSLSTSPASQTLAPGGSVMYVISLQPLNGLSSSVTLTASSLPNGTTASFSPSSIQGTASSTLQVSTTNSTPLGNFTLTVTGTSGTVSHNVDLTLAVKSSAVPAWTPNTFYPVGSLVIFNGQEFRAFQAHTSVPNFTPPNIPAIWQPIVGAGMDFALSATPAAQTVKAGGSATYTISISPVNGFTDAVSISVQGLPANTTAFFNSTPIKGGGTATLTISTSGTTPPGIYTLTFPASSTFNGINTGRSHSVSVTFTVTAP